LSASSLYEQQHNNVKVDQKAKPQRRRGEEKKVCKRSLAFSKICVRAQAKRYAGH
jgi:hypothetical protein